MRTAIPSRPAMEDATNTKDFEPKRALYPPSGELRPCPSDCVITFSNRSTAAPGHHEARERSVGAPRLVYAISVRKAFEAPKFAVRLLVGIPLVATVAGAIRGLELARALRFAAAPSCLASLWQTQCVCRQESAEP